MCISIVDDGNTKSAVLGRGGKTFFFILSEQLDSSVEQVFGFVIFTI